LLKNYKVGIYNKALGTKVNGIFIPGVLAWVKDIMCDVQPYSRALLFKNYGYDIDVNKRIYVDYFDKDIKIGTIIKYIDKYDKTLSLEVKAIPWDDEYMEVMLFGL